MRKTDFYELPESLLCEMDFSGTNDDYGAENKFFNREGVISIDKYKFMEFVRENPQYKNIKIPESVECWPCMLIPANCILNILITPNLKFIGSVFWNCVQFENSLGGRIYYTGSVEEWDELVESYPMRNTVGLDYTDYDRVVSFVDEESFSLPEIDFSGIVEDENDINTVRFCSQSGEITIPTEYVDDYGIKQDVKGIGMLSFAFNEGIEKVIIPPEIECICIDAFRGCSNLKEVYISDSDSPITIDMGAFYNCKNLEKVYIGRKASIGEHAFEKGEGVKVQIESVCNE